MADYNNGSYEIQEREYTHPKGTDRIVIDGDLTRFTPQFKRLIPKREAMIIDAMVVYGEID
jgi:hypothetical protein